MARPASIIVASWQIEHDEVGESDAAAGGFAFFATFLDGNDRCSSAGRKYRGRLLGGCFYRTADFTARDRFPRATYNDGIGFRCLLDNNLPS